MKRKIKYDVNGKTIEREIQYIPGRYIFSVLMAILEIALIIGIMVALCYYVPYFYILAWLTEIGCIITITASDDNPEYKVPWLIIVMVIPIAGFMIYFLFYSRKLKNKYIRRLNKLKQESYTKDDTQELLALEEECPVACSQAKLLTGLAESHVFSNTKTEYFHIGESMHARMLEDLHNAQKFIYLEYFIIEAGEFWNSILDILKEKAKLGLDIRITYDDIGCMTTLPGNYAQTLKKLGIQATPFSRLKGSADSEFNNRSHRKIMVIDGYIGYTGGINIADEYINKTIRFGHWKDIGIRLEGEGVWELTKLFMIDYGINIKTLPQSPANLYPKTSTRAKGYVVPFGDGPKPLYPRRVGKTLIQSMLSSATKYAWITTPYLIIDNDLCLTLENTALKGVDVRIILPHIPDKKIIFKISKSYYARLISAGVKIYEYTPGFIHAKSILVDDKFALISTINLDYRSLVHHFENGVWLYNTKCISDLKTDLIKTFQTSEKVILNKKTRRLGNRFWRSIIRLLAPLL